MDILKGLILGIVQGITEFLPVSSSGHLLLLEKITGISENDGGAFFTTMLHLATLVAVVIVYRKHYLESHKISQKQASVISRYSHGSYGYNSAFI